MKRYFHAELEDVRSHLMLMGERAVESVSLTMRALIDADLRLAEQVIEGDDVVDAIEKQIDEEVVRYTSLRSPVARDLRLLFVAIKCSHDLERVADEASSIAQRTRGIVRAGAPIGSLHQLPAMCDLAVVMLRDALTCFIQEDVDEASAIVLQDRKVDDLNRENFRAFVADMKRDPNSAETCTELVFISKSLERIADHAKNIVEEVYYLLTSQSLKEAMKDMA